MERTVTVMTEALVYVFILCEIVMVALDSF